MHILEIKNDVRMAKRIFTTNMIVFFSAVKNANARFAVCDNWSPRRRQPSRQSRRASPSTSWRWDRWISSQTSRDRWTGRTRSSAECRTPRSWPPASSTKVRCSGRPPCSVCQVCPASAVRPARWWHRGILLPPIRVSRRESRVSRRSCRPRPPALRTIRRYQVRRRPLQRQPAVWLERQNNYPTADLRRPFRQRETNQSWMEQSVVAFGQGTVGSFETRHNYRDNLFCKSYIDKLALILLFKTSHYVNVKIFL